MKAIILAAGVGSRISKYIEENHKCLLPIPIAISKGEQKQVPLLHYTIEILQKYGVKDISIVTGYLHNKIEASVSEFFGVETFYNPFYELVNSIGSLWFCNHKITANDDLLVLNADTFLEEPLIKNLCTQAPTDHTPLLLIDTARAQQADVKVCYDLQTQMLVEYGKDIARESMAESLDVCVIPRAHAPQFRTQLMQMLEQKKFDTWWESALVDYMEQSPILVCNVAPYFWSEIDFFEDYQRICDYLLSR